MATLNFAQREITAKLVYFGASGAGCNTNVKQLHKRLDRARSSPLHAFGPRDAETRSYFFEHRADAEIHGFAVRWRIYSLPGSIPLAAHREEVMRDVDAVAFVADARAERDAANVDALLELERLLSLQGLELAAAPVVIQINHNDAQDARPADQVLFELDPYGFPTVSAVAREGRGVLDTFRELTGALVPRLRDSLSGSDAAVALSAVHRTEPETDEDVVRAHLEAIQARAASTPEAALFEQLPLTVEDAEPAVESAVPVQPRELAGFRPVQLLSAQVVDHGVIVELLMRRTGSEEVRTLRLRLENRPPDPPPPLVAPPPADPIADYLPDSVDLGPPADDLPPVAYGVLGLVGGLLMGLLSGYLFGFLS